jgi:hypothetical protein
MRSSADQAKKALANQKIPSGNSDGFKVYLKISLTVMSLSGVIVTVGLLPSDASDQPTNSYP